MRNLLETNLSCISETSVFLL